jgi:hypothetical protein
MKLPKLYRKVYLKFEWCIDSLQGGEHHQDWGYNLIPARRVLDSKGGWFWSVIDWIDLDVEKEYFDKYTHHEEDGWEEYDSTWFDFNEDNKHDPYLSYNRITIKEQKRSSTPSLDKITKWCSDIPF